MPRYSPRTGLLQEYQVGPFDSTHLYVQWGGKLNGGETWSCGFRMWKPTGSTPSDATFDLPLIANAIEAYHTRPTTAIHPSCKLSFVKVNAIAVNGQYQSQSTTEKILADIAGTGNSYPNVNHPNQVAWAVSLTTGFSRGPAHRGRWFNPAPCIGTEADGKVSAAAADALALSVDTLRADVNQALDNHVMVVMSRKAGAPGHRAVTGTEIGRVYDTQRRRRRSLVEDYQTGT